MAHSRKERGKRGQAVVAYERRLQAVQLRKDGYTYREIALATGVSECTAYQDVSWILKKSLDDASESIEEARRLELERVDNLWNKMSEELERPLTVDDKQKVINACTRLSKRRSELLGLDMPIKIAPTMPDGTLIPATMIVPNREERKLMEENNGKNGNS